MVQDRRVSHNDTIQPWDKLSLAQKFAMNELNHYGYHLAFVREDLTESTAFALLDDRAATINSDGEINLNPEAEIRK